MRAVTWNTTFDMIPSYIRWNASEWLIVRLMTAANVLPTSLVFLLVKAIENR